METTPSHTLNITGVLSESKRIILANYSHFIALSLPFLPLTFSLLTSDPHKFSPNHQKLIIYHLLYTLIIYTLFICSIATITYSTYQAFFGEPLNFLTSLKSLTFSFFPLASTAIVAHALLFLISLAFLLFVGMIIISLQNLGFVIDYNSIYFMWFSVIVGVILIGILIYFHVNWSLAFVIVVVESKWGISPLIRSSYLVKGMRSVSLLVYLYFVICGAGIVWIYQVNFNESSMSTFVLITMLTLFFLMMVMLRITAANTVLYNYCKALHGELAIDVSEAFANEYVNLPYDDDKVPHVVTVVRA